MKFKVNGFTTTFELDSGSAVSTLREEDAKAAGILIEHTHHKVVGYSGNFIKLFGEAKTNIATGSKKLQHKFLIVNSCKSNLLGRDLMSKLNIKINVPMEAEVINKVEREYSTKYEKYLSDDFQSNVVDEVDLNLLSDATPIFCKARTVPIRMQELVKNEINRLVNNGTITKIYSSKWASPTVNVVKSSNAVRICGDFSATVNKHLDPVNTTLPSIDDVISQVGNCKVFSKIDLENAFLQLPLSESSKQYAVINTIEGLFQYNYLPFGLTASPGIFQSFMCKLLNGIDNVIVYQDDILVLTPTVKDHEIVLDKVLSTLQKACIKLNVKKCNFFTDSIQYLGHIFDSDGVHPNPEKVRAIIDAPAPKDLKQLQSFLGLCNFYSRFIDNYSHVVAPLYCLLKKEKQFFWGPKQIESFHVVKDLFTSSKVLKMFNPDHETLLETDSSGYGIAAVLLQRESKDAPWTPVQFCSRSLIPGEKNYSNIEREALSIVYGCTKYRKFLLGKHFVIRNDQQPLKKLFAKFKPAPTTCSSRIIKWALTLSQFNYTLEYSPGNVNVNSDCLSRLPLPECEANICQPYELIFALEAFENMPITASDIRYHTESDKDMLELIEYIKHGCPHNITNPTLSSLKNKISDMCIFDGCILYQNRVFVPHLLRRSVLGILHDCHPGIVAMKSLARSLVWYPGIDHDIETLVKSCPECISIKPRPPKSNIRWPIAPKNWSRIHVDHFYFENHIIFLAVDSLTKYIECEVVASTSVNETIDAMRLIFSRHGLCDVLVSDNASCFTAFQFKKFLENNNIEHITPPPYSPASNGQAERAVGVIKNLLKKSDKSKSFKTRMASVLLQYRSTPHSITNMPPCVSLNKRKFITLRDRLNPKFCNVKSKPKDSIKLPNFKVGDNVHALNFSTGPKWYYGKIVEKLGINVFNVLLEDLDVVWKRHSNQLLPAFPKPMKFPHITRERELPNINAGRNVVTLPIVNEPVSVTIEPEVEINQPVVRPVLRRSERIRKPVSRYGIVNST